MKPTRTFSELDWHLTPEPVRHYIMALERALHDVNSRVEIHEKEGLRVRLRVKAKGQVLIINYSPKSVERLFPSTAVFFQDDRAGTDITQGLGQAAPIAQPTRN